MPCGYKDAQRTLPYPARLGRITGSTKWEDKIGHNTWSAMEAKIRLIQLRMEMKKT